MRFWTHYWQNGTVEDYERGDTSKALNHTAGSEFVRRGVTSGDVVYLVTNRRGLMTVLGSLDVEAVTDTSGAVTHLGTEDLWDAPDHLIGTSTTGWQPVTLSPQDASALRFLTRSGAETGLVVDAAGLVDQQTLRGVRETTLASALQINRLLSAEKLLPDMDLDYEGDEGSPIARKHLRRERDPKLRQRKIEAVLKVGDSIKCEVCQFDFSARYGKRGDGYIEVHHRRPLHDSGPTRTKLSDLALVCSNCHRMIHRRSPWLTVEDLKQLVVD